MGLLFNGFAVLKLTKKLVKFPEIRDDANVMMPKQFNSFFRGHFHVKLNLKIMCHHGSQEGSDI